MLIRPIASGILLACDLFDVRLSEFFGRCVTRRCTFPRWAVVKAAYEEGFSYEEIANAIERDRTTIYNSIERAEAWSTRHHTFALRLELIQAVVHNERLSSQ